MKTFKRHKTFDEIVDQCRTQKLYLDAESYFLEGGDTICVGAPSSGLGWVIFNTFNGRFFGKTDKGIEFSSDTDEHDKEPWMQALLNFFYVEKEGV